MTAFQRLRAKVSYAVGLDRAVFFAITGKIWSMGAGLVTTLLVASYFSLSLQGYYYTFFSVIALQVFAEMGLSTVISSYASHEWAKLSFDKNGTVMGDPSALSRLTSLARFALTWYTVAGLLIAVALTVGGFVFFGATESDRISLWAGPWTLLCVVTGLNLCLMPVWSLLEGCNQVANVYLYRLTHSVVSSIAVWLGIYLGAELWATSFMGIAAIATIIISVWHRYRAFIKQVILTKPGGPRINWRSEILPMQWRLALSWMSGYFTFSLFVPVLFHYQGSAVAGQAGMTWTFINALTGVASSWINPKAPTFAILIAQRRYAVLDQMFWRLMVIVVAVTCLGGFTLWTVVYMLAEAHHPYAERLMSPLAVGCLLVATIVMATSLPMSTYLRAHKKEPLLGISLINGVLTGIAVIVMARYYSAEGVAIGYLAVNLLTVPFVALIWKKCCVEWHNN